MTCSAASGGGEEEQRWFATRDGGNYCGVVGVLPLFFCFFSSASCFVLQLLTVVVVVVVVKGKNGAVDGGFQIVMLPFFLLCFFVFLLLCFYSLVFLSFLFVFVFLFMSLVLYSFTFQVQLCFFVFCPLKQSPICLCYSSQNHALLKKNLSIFRPAFFFLFVSLPKFPSFAFVFFLSFLFLFPVKSVVCFSKILLCLPLLLSVFHFLPFPPTRSYFFFKSLSLLETLYFLFLSKKFQGPLMFVLLPFYL